MRKCPTFSNHDGNMIMSNKLKNISLGDLVSALPGRPGSKYLLSTRTWMECDGDAVVASSADAVFIIEPGSIGTVIEKKFSGDGTLYALVMFSQGLGWVRNDKVANILKD
jgi:hypothetical protein